MAAQGAQVNAVRLTTLDPRFVGAGGDGVYSRTDKLCLACNGENSGVCPRCHGDGFEYAPAPERHGVGLSFLCPCATCAPQRTGDQGQDFHLRQFVAFRNPLDGGPPHDPREGAQWTREGDTFDTLTLRPSILSAAEKGGCGFHGFVTNGEVTW